MKSEIIFLWIMAEIRAWEASLGQCGQVRVGEGKGSPPLMSESWRDFPHRCSLGNNPKTGPWGPQEMWEELLKAQTKHALFRTQQKLQLRKGSQHSMPELSSFPIFHLISWL